MAMSTAMSELGSAVSFEWTKIRTLRSTGWNLGAFLVVSVGLGLLTGLFLHTTDSGPNASIRGQIDPVAAGFSGPRTGMIALIVFGVLIVTSEYSSGTVHSSLIAVPRRGVWYSAKLIAGGLTALAASAVVMLSSFLVTEATAGPSLSVTLTDPGAARALVGAVLYTTLLSLMASGLAAVLRSSALTIGILIPLFFIVSTVLNNIGSIHPVAQFLPDIAGGQVFYQHAQPGTVLTPWTGMAVLLAWTVLAAAAGYLSIRQRDAA